MRFGMIHLFVATLIVAVCCAWPLATLMLFLLALAFLPLLPPVCYLWLTWMKAVPSEEEAASQDDVALEGLTSSELVSRNCD